MIQSETSRMAVPYWWETTRIAQVPQQAVPSKVDVAIVGAGYMGLSAGLVLARAGRSVAAFDAMGPGEGASTRNGGVTSGTIRPDFETLTRRFGIEQATAIEMEGKEAREFLYHFIESEGIECDFKLTGQIKGALGHDQYAKLSRQTEALAKRLGIEAYSVPYSAQSGFIGSDLYRGIAVRMDIGGLNPAKLHAGLLRVAMHAGLMVHAHTPVISIENEGNAFRITTSAGILRAGQVLVCTNGYTDGSAPFLRRRLVPVRSRMIATEEVDASVMARLMPKAMMAGDTRALGFYFRPSPDGKRILIGGRDSSRVGDPAAPTLRVKNGLTEIFPELAGVGLSHSWFGNVAMNRDMIPRVFERDGVVYASGCCGSGVVWANWIGMRVAHKLMGNKDQARTAFDFRPPAAIPLYRGDPWFMPAIIKGFAAKDLVSRWRAVR